MLIEAAELVELAATVEADLPQEQLMTAVGALRVLAVTWAKQWPGFCAPTPDVRELGAEQLAREDAGRDVARLWVGLDNGVDLVAHDDLVAALDRLAAAHGLQV